MAGLRVRRSWWTMQQAEAPLFRVLAQHWRPVDRRERRLKPFQLALGVADKKPLSRGSFGPKTYVVVATTAKSARTWNPWMMMK